MAQLDPNRFSFTPWLKPGEFTRETVFKQFPVCHVENAPR
jgi:hypothetical protein